MMWNIVRVNSEFHALKITESDGNYDFFLSNLKSIWKKKFAENEIVSIIREFNPQIEATPTVLVKGAISSLEEINGGKELSCELDSSAIVLKPHFTIGGFSLKFNLKLDLMEDESIFKEITLPLVMMLQQMKEREEDLMEIIRKKEDEIEDYRIGGAKLSNKMWKTKKFDKKIFSEERCQSKKLEEILQNPTSIFLTYSSLFDSVSKSIVESKRFDEGPIDDSAADLSHSPDLFDEPTEPEAKTMSLMNTKPAVSKMESMMKKSNYKRRTTNKNKLNI